MVDAVTVPVDGHDIIIQTGRVARQAHGSVTVQCGDTVVLVTAAVAPERRKDIDFFPLTVEYRERTYAAGKIPGNFFRREGRPTEREVLVSRLIDRPVRPLFPEDFQNEVQVMATVMSSDTDSNPDVLSVVGASTALMISCIPFNGPIGAIRIGRTEGRFVVNPGYAETEQSDLDIVVAGTRDAIIMVEGNANAVAESDLLDALELAHQALQPIIDAQYELQQRVGEPKLPVEPVTIESSFVERVTEFAENELVKIFETERDKKSLNEAILRVFEDVSNKVLDGGRASVEETEEQERKLKKTFETLLQDTFRRKLLGGSTRLDGRKPDELRRIECEVGVLPRTHGSALFTRGDTQALVAATLGTSRDEQRLEELQGETFRRFMLHYNFPPFSVGEVRPLRGPGRREIGHGALAERALRGVMPSSEEFPYTVRIVSDILESNGSSSMASVCGATLALMDAGVPISAPVAGVSVGLVKEGDRYVVLTDILGLEDHYGDMDFKIAGTRDGITAVQMDLKTKGVTREIMQEAMICAREARLKILDKMLEVIPEPRAEISEFAPRITTIKIDVDKIRDIIGPGGKTVREIQNQTGAVIEIDDDGTVNVAAVDKEAMERAVKIIRELTAVPEVGQVYTGPVKRILNFGAFVEILPNQEGLVHISELAHEHVRRVEDVLKVGDEVTVKCIEIDPMGRVNLSKKALDPPPAKRSRSTSSRTHRQSRRPSDGRHNNRSGRQNR